MKKLFCLLFTSLLAFSCAVEVKTTQRTSADLTRYSSFCWLNSCDITASGNVKVKDTTLQSKLKRALTLEMKQKGLKLDAANPELLLGIYVTLKDERTISYRKDDETPLFWPNDTKTEMMLYTKGTIIVTMADRETGNLVWESTAVSYMDFHTDPSKARIRNAVHQILKDFPGKK